MMLCEYLSLQCFVLVKIRDNVNPLNSTDRLRAKTFSCKQRCGKIGLDVPSFSTVQKSDWEKIYSQYQSKYARKFTQRDHVAEDKICTFPIKTKYSFDTNEWFDEDSNEVLNLPWKKPETTMGPFYPIMNDVLWLVYPNWTSQFENWFSPDGFLFQHYDSARCEKFNSYFESVKAEMTYLQRHKHQELFDANADYLCNELSFYCVNLETGDISGPWESTSGLESL